MTTLYTVELAPAVTDPEGKVVKPAREVGFVELSFGDVMKAFQLGGQEGNERVANMRTRLAGLQLAIREVGGKTVAYTDLQGSRWDGMFSARETMLLMSAWAQVHEPSPEDFVRAKNSLRAASGTSPPTSHATGTSR